MIKEVVLDTETTGLSIEKDRIVEIACIELDNHLPSKNLFHTFLNPEGVRVSEDAFEIHGYSNEFLSDKPKFKDIVKNFLQFIQDKKIIIHNADFDINFLNKELRNLNLEPINKQNVIDSLVLAREKFPGATAKNLTSLCKKFKIDTSAREKHSALLDCKLLSKVYVELIDDKEFKFLYSDFNENINQNIKTNKSPGIVVQPSLDDIENYKKFLKKNLVNAFSLKD